jgi:uracil-DNA glycosylase family 4
MEVLVVEYFVGPDGPLTAKIAIVGEKPGRVEVRTGRPFTGPTGNELNDLLSKVGISRSQLYITNVVKHVNSFDNPTFDEVAKSLPSLFKELAKLPNLRMLIPMGGTAFAAMSLMQLIPPKVKGPDRWKSGIGSYRGSILPSPFTGVKMVPTYHPAAYLHGGEKTRGMKDIIRFDLGRALEESYDPNLNLPNRSYFIAETRQDVSTIKELFTNASYISFDIELMRGRFIECIGFAKEPNAAYCIPITKGNRQTYWSTSDELFVWRTIQHILAQEGVTYVTQNGLFDCWHLWRHGIDTPYMANSFDTMLMHRLRAPDLPHDLGFLTSIYTREPYYKDESGDWKAQIRAIPDQQFYVYNCKDAACTLEVCHELIKDLAEYDMLDYYRSEIAAQWDCVVAMRQKGMHVSYAALSATRNRISTEVTTTSNRIQTLLGWLPNTRSSIDMGKLYVQLGITYSKTAKGAAKRDIEQLYSYAYNYPKHRDLLYAIANLNELQTLRSGFLGMVLDEFGFYHPSLSISKTVTGRMASAGADEGGPQIQNIPQSLRNLFVPDNPNEDEFTQADLKGAEAMLLAWFTEDPLLLNTFIQGKDVHRVRGAVIYRSWNQSDLPPDKLLASILEVCGKCMSKGELKCNHSERYMAKKNGHAFAYLQGVRRAARELRKIGVFVAESELERIKRLVVTTAISNWHKRTELELRRSAWLQLPLGRKREFYGTLDQEMLRAALSWKCQATVGQITNRAMISLHNKFSQLSHPRITPPRIVTQTHDSLLINHAKDFRPYVIAALIDAFNQPMEINGRSLTIPIDITHGPNWGEMK